MNGELHSPNYDNSTITIFFHFPSTFYGPPRNWIGRDPTHWENPLEFRPERFTAKGRSFGVDVKGKHYHFLPFGSGRRRCPGISLANGGAVDMTEGHGGSLHRAHPMRERERERDVGWSHK
ncbi:unnamed protein product [Spirodela intermedia]|uniref:Uncharacterized protein n=2 Tax=Spirodela intermedia TaxID=51605 RepID=A0A7I8LI86_SPIIN|nr:unnamed protein product [Spirodela intermedia]CAA6672319.1 unnamed protein product [Spirodela intermedia]CAA7409500.1 unnamed protein product [Spirodela intermedia]